jgi:hypothetical protein
MIFGIEVVQSCTVHLISVPTGSEDDLDEAYSKYGKDEKFMQNFSYKPSKEDTTLET